MWDRQHFSSQQSKRYIFKPTNTEVPLACRSLSYEAIPCCFKLDGMGGLALLRSMLPLWSRIWVYMSAPRISPFTSTTHWVAVFKIFLFDHIKYTFLFLIIKHNSNHHSITHIYIYWLVVSNMFSNNIGIILPLTFIFFRMVKNTTRYIYIYNEY